MNIEDLKKKKAEITERLKNTREQHTLNKELREMEKEEKELKHELSLDPVKEARKKKLKKKFFGVLKAIDHGLDNFAKNTSRIVKEEFGKPKKEEKKHKDVKK